MSDVGDADTRRSARGGNLVPGMRPAGRRSWVALPVPTQLSVPGRSGQVGEYE